MALTNAQLWITAGSPTFPTSQTDWTQLWVGTVNSDLGAGLQIIHSQTYLSDDGIVLYYDNTSNQSSVVWFLDSGGGGFEQGVFGTRIPLSTLVAVVLRSSSTNVNGAWLNLEDPSASWVTASTTNPISGQGGNSSMNLSSSSSPGDHTSQIFRGWNGQLTNEECATEARSANAVRRFGLLFDVAMDDGDVTSPWINKSGDTNNDFTQQGGTAPTAAVNFALLGSDVVHEWGASEFVIAAAATSILRQMMAHHGG